jgi:hypothetical protein
MIKISGGPSQPFAEGVTVMVELIGEAVVFTVVKAGIDPVPPEPSPIAVLLFDQVNTVPAVVLASVVAGALTPGQ